MLLWETFSMDICKRHGAQEDELGIGTVLWSKYKNINAWDCTLLFRVPNWICLACMHMPSM